MASTKRSHKDEDACIPAVKRRIARGGRSGKNDNSAMSMSRSTTTDGDTRTRKPVIIDLSGDEEYSDAIQSVKAIMKRLPPDSIKGDFPCFKEGAVCIIIDPKSSVYQYRLHKTTLSRVSPVFAKFLQLPCPEEVMEKWKIAATGAQARFELTYFSKHGKWVLRRAPFTAWKQIGACMKAGPGESVSKAAASSDRPDGENFPPAVKPNIDIRPESPKIITATPGILSSGIAVAQITIADVTKYGESNSQEDSANNFPLTSCDKYSPIERQVQAESTEDEENCGDLVSVNREDNSQASFDPPLVKCDATTETGKEQSTLVDSKPDDLPSPSEDDDTVKKDQEDSHAIISSFGNEEAKVLLKTSELETFDCEKEIPVPDSVSTGLNSPAVDSANLDNNSTTKTEEGKSNVIKSTYTLDIAQTSAETSAHQAIGQQEIPCALKPSSVIGPPIELCETYNNLFLIFYNKPPVISTTSISIALKQCEDLSSVAKTLGSLSVIRPYLGNAISRFGKQLYLAIAAEPFRWLELSMILESAVVFKESMIHIVGIYTPVSDGQINLPEELPQFVRDLILFKVRYLDQQRMDVNERLFASSIVVNSETVTFSFVDAAIFSTWLVVQIWRDWFCRQMVGVHLDPHKTGQLYRTLAKSGDAYLPAEAVKAVVEKIREPIKAEPDELREDLELLKKFAQEAVKELCENNSMIDVQEAGIGYLTCTRIMDEELPWFKTEQ